MFCCVNRLWLLALVAAVALLHSVHGSESGSPASAKGHSHGKRPRSGLLREVLDPLGAGAAQHGEPLCRPTGQIEDACSDYESVESYNEKHVFHKLDELRKTDYFRYFSVDLFKDCPFWVDDGLCMNRACVVESMNETDIPEEFRMHRLSEVKRSAEDDQRGRDTSGTTDASKFCELDDECADSQLMYVDLLKNPERFTGYAGDSANRVWRSIYEENCFGGVKYIEPPRAPESGGRGYVSKERVANSKRKAIPPTLLMPSSDQAEFDSMVNAMEAPVDAASMEQCLEKRIFYRVISGLHASISIHICNEYLDQQTGEWGPNLECFISRISQHPERLQNVYFNNVLLLRALAKLGEYFDKFELRAGDEIRNPATRAQLHDLLRAARESRPSFDEHRLFNIKHDAVLDAQTLALKEDFRQHFLNISRIMDCVGCDKCRLWGKIQVSGIGTALKLLFGFDAADPEPKVTLRRNELVALINTAHRLSESLQSLETFRKLYQELNGPAVEQVPQRSLRQSREERPPAPRAAQKTPVHQLVHACHRKASVYWSQLTSILRTHFNALRRRLDGWASSHNSYTHPDL